MKLYILVIIASMALGAGYGLTVKPSADGTVYWVPYDGPQCLTISDGNMLKSGDLITLCAKEKEKN